MIEIDDEAELGFNMLKDVINGREELEYIDGFYYPRQAIEMVERCDRCFHLNKYMDLTISDILNYVSDHLTLEGAIDEIYSVYRESYADSWAENLMYILRQL